MNPITVFQLACWTIGFWTIGLLELKLEPDQKPSLSFVIPTSRDYYQRDY